MVKYFNQLKTELKDKSRDEIIEALDVAYQLLDDRERLFEVIPECPEHGPKCTPHAIEWIKLKNIGTTAIATDKDQAILIAKQKLKEFNESKRDI